jgi:hypothetical protein
VIGGVPIIVIDGAVQPRGGSQPAPGKFGIASECEPSCSVKRTPTGEYYYKYDTIRALCRFASEALPTVSAFRWVI